MYIGCGKLREQCVDCGFLHTSLLPFCRVCGKRLAEDGQRAYFEKELFSTILNTYIHTLHSPHHSVCVSCPECHMSWVLAQHDKAKSEGWQLAPQRPVVLLGGLMIEMVPTATVTVSSTTGTGAI